MSDDIKTRLLGALDRALAPTPREQLVADGRALLTRVRAKFGDAIASEFGPRILFSKSTQERAKAMLEGPAARGPAPTPVKATVPGLLPPAPPKPAEPTISTATLKAATYDSVHQMLPAEFLSLPEPDQRRALLRACWRTHCETALPLSVQAEVPAAVEGLRRAPANVNAAAGAFRRQNITRSLKRAKITAQ